jgi:hypothetical protein
MLVMQDVVCSLEEYYSVKFQRFILKECSGVHNRWIYDIIHNSFAANRKQIFIQEEEWCLCADQHNGNDTRFLVVFKDTTLLTMLELRSSHVPLLRELRSRVRAWLVSQHMPQSFFYFHYMPSVFQLHLHVVCSRQHMNRNRAQCLSTVIRNLERDSLHYTKAMMLTIMCRTLRRSETHTTVQVAI